MTVRHRLNPNWESELRRTVPLENATEPAAEEVVKIAQRRAPAATGAGADSIHHEPDGRGGFRVSWDPEHDYMRFHEHGTEKMNARPFLRPAAIEVDKRR